MKNKKLELKELKVQSFVTQISRDTEETIKGGVSEDGCVETGFIKCGDGKSIILGNCEDGIGSIPSLLNVCSLIC